jgi:hypothetical protein
MDLDIRMANERFKEFLPAGRDLQMNKDNDFMTRSEILAISYIGPRVSTFHDKLDKVLTRFGWDQEEEILDSQTKRIYIKLKRDGLISPSEQGKKLLEKREAEKASQAGLRDINI